MTKSNKSSLAAAIAPGLLFLTACAGPLTKPETGVFNCQAHLNELSFASYFKRDDQQHLAARGLLRQFFKRPMSTLKSRSRNSDGKLELNILVLSGGGQWGAYGAGFMNGWSQLEDKLPNADTFINRSDIDMVTGISTGALQSTLVFAGIDKQHREKADADLKKYYTPESPDEILKVESELWALIKGRNALGDSSPLEAQVEQMIGDFGPIVKNQIPADRQLVVGIANARNGRMYLADMRGTLEANRRDCYREFLMASAAVPFTFPPRFIDGEMYVDGGVRFGAFLPLFWEDLAIEANENGIDLSDMKVNVLTIINGSLTATDDPECELFDRCEKVKNSLLGVAKKSVSIITDSVYNFSAFAIAQGAKRHGYDAEIRFAYAPPDLLAAAKCKKDGAFNRIFMECLYDAGEADGKNQLFRDPFPSFN